ncbi:unnamed protein product [Schistocephalus solidus]|uniref:Expressed conserved protein n=1 Tax=Schistocephalus solidus TaxID=70667 RepID=A0A183SZ97_SCHSO|nr:unnamed protein product [Schistocephalus solidus]
MDVPQSYSKYVRKTNALLDDLRAYLRCDGDPMKKLAVKINATRASLQSSVAISKADNKTCRFSHARFYGLPKGTPRMYRNVNGDTSSSWYLPAPDRQPNGHRTRSTSRPRLSSENRLSDPQEPPLQRQQQPQQQKGVSSPKVAARAPQPPPRPALPKKPVSRSATESASSSHGCSFPTSVRPLRHYSPVRNKNHKEYYEEDEEEDGTLRLVSDIDLQAMPAYDSPSQAASDGLVLSAHRTPTGLSASRVQTLRPLRSVGNRSRSSFRNVLNTADRPMPDYENLEELKFRKILEREVMSGDPRPDLKELGVIGDGSTSVVFPPELESCYFLGTLARLPLHSMYLLPLPSDFAGALLVSSLAVIKASPACDVGGVRVA